MDCPKCQTTIQDHEVAAEFDDVSGDLEVKIKCGSCGSKYYTYVSEDQFTPDH